MFKLFGKIHFSGLLALFSLSTMDSSLMAQEIYSAPYTEDFQYGSPYAEQCCYVPQCNRFYIGAFGGELFSNSTKITQTGTAFFTEAEGGPLAVDARGRTKRKSTGFGGVQIGYEWAQCPISLGCSNWSLTPAAEIEALFYRHSKRGHLINPTARLPEHDFLDTFHLNVGVYLVNGVITFNNCGWNKLSPYIGGGIGAANISIRKADSLQVAPVEAGVNHFNSDRSDTAWTFAVQAKAGLRYNICERFHVFAEYRFLYLDSSRYIFGSTNYPTHAPTSTWNVDVKNIWYNSFAVGIRFDI